MGASKDLYLKDWGVDCFLGVFCCWLILLAFRTFLTGRTNLILLTSLTGRIGLTILIFLIFQILLALLVFQCRLIGLSSQAFWFFWAVRLF